MKFLLGLALVISMSCLAAVSPKASYRKYEDVVVSRWSSTSWKLLSASETRTTEQGAIDCAVLLGDGWHLPSESDWRTDFEDVSKSAIATTMGNEKFWLSNAEHVRGKAVFYRAGNLVTKEPVRVDASKASQLPTACVCGPKVSHVESRRTKQRCAGFHDGHQTEPKEISLLLNEKKEFKVDSLDNAKMDCARKGMRLPIYAEVNSIKLDLAKKLHSRGCVWSASPGEENRVLVHTFETLHGVMGKGQADPSRVECHVACVL